MSEGRRSPTVKLSGADTRAVLELVGECHASEDLTEFRRSMLRGLRELVPCAIATYNEVEPASMRAIAVVEPEEAAIWADPNGALARVSDSHPLIQRYARTRDGRAYKMSDLVSAEELRATALWREAFEPLGLNHQIAFALPSQPTIVIGVALSRVRPDFSERDRNMLNLARPHLIQAYRGARTRSLMMRRASELERALESSDQGVVTLVGSGDEVGALRGSAEAILEEVFGPSRRPTMLPETIRSWLASIRNRGVRFGSPPLVIGVGGGHLVVQFVRRRRSGDADLLLLRLAADPLKCSQLQALGLSGREAEVLRLAALGDAPDGIAAALRISPATARRHLANIYGKLGVHSRAQAVATAWAGAQTTAAESPDR